MISAFDCTGIYLMTNDVFKHIVIHIGRKKTHTCDNHLKCICSAGHFKGSLQIRKKLLQQGVFFQAAAIGSDKEAIQEIYEESFLDITDLEQLPALLTKKLLRFIRR